MSDKAGFPQWEIIRGDALQLLRDYPASSFDAVITDPPYASGGRTQAEKNKSTAQKYSSMGENAPPSFEGDAKDQRSFTSWCAAWLSECRRIVKPGAPVCVFIDWRQLPSMTDAIQWQAGSGGAPPYGTREIAGPSEVGFRQQAEYIVWGSNGDMPISRACALPTRRIQVWQSAKSHPSHGKALAAHAGYRPHCGAGRPYSGSFCRSRNYGVGGYAGRLFCHRL